MTGVLAGVTTPAHAVQVILISVGIPLVVCGSIAVIVWAYFRLQSHRADAVAMAHYRKLAEEAVAAPARPCGSRPAPRGKRSWSPDSRS